MALKKPALPSCDGTESCHFVTARVSWAVNMIYRQAKGVFDLFVHCLLHEVKNLKTKSFLSQDKLYRHYKPHFFEMD